MKEVKFRPNIGSNDYETKLRQIQKFLLKEGEQVRVTVQFRGRENAHKDRGIDLLGQVTRAFKEKARIGPPRITDRAMSIMLFPKPRGTAGVLVKVP